MNNRIRNPKERTTLHPAPDPDDEWTSGPNPGPVDLQIVGGGLAGLVAANQAVDAGLTVRLIEKQQTAGGRAASADRHGYTVNEGPHALYLNGELQAALTGFGIDVPGSPPGVEGALGRIGDTVGLLPQGPGSMLRTSLLSARSKVKLAAILARLPRTNPESVANMTVDRWLADLSDDPQLRTLLSGLVNLATYNSASDRASADAAVIQLQRALDDGVIYVDGGWKTIVDSLEQRLDGPESTGRFERVTETVTAIDSDSDPSGHHLVITGDAGVGGTSYPSANVLLAPGSPAVVDRLLGTGTAISDAAGPPVWAAALDLGLRQDTSISTLLGLDTRLYLATHSVAAGLAPSGQTLVTVARYVRPDDERPAKETKAMLVAHAEAAGIRPDDIVMSRYLHRLTVTWGMPLAERGGLSGRPSVRVADRPGMYLAGDWVGGRGVLADASGASAVDAVAAMVADPARRAKTPIAVG